MIPACKMTGYIWKESFAFIKGLRETRERLGQQEFIRPMKTVLLAVPKGKVLAVPSGYI